MKKEGFINDYKFIDDGKQGILKVYLKYKGTRRDKKPIMEGIIKVSKSGRRVYVNTRNIPKVKGGLGIAILSTSLGVMTDKEAREKKVGGEVICYVW
jgi:small subunit ribosomal protein S8